MKIAFTVLGVAAPQGSLVPIRSASTGRMFQKQSNKRTMPWRQEVAGAAMTEVLRVGWLKANGPVELRVVFFLTRPKGHYGKKGLLPRAPKYPDKKPDLDKLARAIGDALTGIIYDDDAMIVSSVTKKLYADGGCPRTEIEVEELT